MFFCSLLKQITVVLVLDLVCEVTSAVNYAVTVRQKFHSELKAGKKRDQLTHPIPYS